MLALGHNKVYSFYYLNLWVNYKIFADKIIHCLLNTVLVFTKQISKIVQSLMIGDFTIRDINDSVLFL